jgi:hypothetical protein
MMVNILAHILSYIFFVIYFPSLDEDSSASSLFTWFQQTPVGELSSKTGKERKQKHAKGEFSNKGTSWSAVILRSQDHPSHLVMRKLECLATNPANWELI